MVFRSVQVLRAVAALLVVVFHSSTGHFGIGAAGVDIFFVISGFIMATVGTRELPSTFLVRRVIRIVPLYWILTLAMLALSMVSPAYAHTRFTAPSLLQSLLFIPYTNFQGKQWPLLVPGWTLNYEMFFYAVFTAGLARGKPVLWTATVMITLAAVGLMVRPETALGKVWMNPMLLEFVLGLFVGKVHHVLGWRSGLLLVAFGVAALLVNDQLAETSRLRVMLWGVPAAALVSGAVAIESGGKWSSLRLLEKLGDASYSLYLVHTLVIGAVVKTLGRGPAASTVAVLASIVVAVAVFQTVERPITRTLRSVADPSRGCQPIKT